MAAAIVSEIKNETMDCRLGSKEMCRAVEKKALVLSVVHKREKNIRNSGCDL